MRLKFFKVEVKNKIEKISNESLEVLGEFYVAKVQDAISDIFPPASDPYTPPHARSWDLYRSIQFEIGLRGGKRILRVGSHLPYARCLEMGTVKMYPRPFLLVTVMANLEEGERMIQDIARRSQL